jgi:hypothetical protein
VTPAGRPALGLLAAALVLAALSGSAAATAPTAVVSAPSPKIRADVDVPLAELAGRAGDAQAELCERASSRT